MAVVGDTIPKTEITPQGNEEKNADFSGLEAEYVSKTLLELKEVYIQLNIAVDGLISNDTDGKLVPTIDLLKKIQQRLVYIIMEVQNESMVDLALHVNDDVTTAIGWYNAHTEGKEYKAINFKLPSEIEKVSA